MTRPTVGGYLKREGLATLANEPVAELLRSARIRSRTGRAGIAIGQSSSMPLWP